MKSFTKRKTRVLSTIDNNSLKSTQHFIVTFYRELKLNGFSFLSKIF